MSSDTAFSTTFFVGKCRPEAASDIISGVAINYVGVDASVNFGVPRSNCSSVIRAAHFVMDERRPTDRPTTDGRYGKRRNHHSVVSPKSANWWGTQNAASLHFHPKPSAAAFMPFFELR